MFGNKNRPKPASTPIPARNGPPAPRARQPEPEPEPEAPQARRPMGGGARRQTAPAATPARPSLFGGGRFGATKSRSQGNYVNPGTYVVEVVKMVALSSKKPGKKGNEMFVLELTILEVLAAYEGDQVYGPSNRAGELCAVIHDVTKNEEIALGNIKNLLVSCAQSADPEFHEQDLTPDEWEETLSEAVEEPGTRLAGTRLVLTAGKRTTVEGNPFTTTTFGPFQEQESA